MARKIYSKKIKDNLDEYYYYIVRKKNGEYYIVSEAILYDKVAPTVTVVWGHIKQCLKIKKEEIGEIIDLIEKDVELFEEEYGFRDWQDC